MPHTDYPTLQRMRAWRTWLLIVTGFGQGLQWVLLPDRALNSPALDRLTSLGHPGWRAVGFVLIAVSVLLIGPESRHTGHLLGFTVYLLLVVAIFAADTWPALTLLAAGLHGGEFYVWIHRRQRG